MAIARGWLAPIGAWAWIVVALGPAPAGPSGRWVGQDGHDLVDKAAGPGASTVQDLHFVLHGLPAGAKIVSGTVHGEGGGEWKFGGPPGSWLALAVQPAGSSTADVYIEPYQIETGRWFEFQLVFDNGRSTTVQVRGGKADPNLRVPSARMEARWVGQDRRDLVGPGPNAGPDGLQDAHIALARLTPKAEVRSLLIAGPAGLRWQFGPNPEAFPRAELVRSPTEPGRADLYFQPGRDLAGQALKLTLAYADGKIDTATLAAGKGNPGLAMAHPTPPTLAPLALKATWLGQGGGSGEHAGDVRVALEGLPASGRIVGADLGDGDGTAWSDRAGGDVPEALPLTFRRGSDPTKAELRFPPVRDESGASLTLRVVFADGQSAVGSFPGGLCDPTLRAEPPAASSVVAKPGDDLNDLANRYGNVVLSAGTYTLARPLVLNRPVTITSDGGAEIVFAQAAGEPAWTAAIKVHVGRTTLDNLTIRFAGPVRWDGAVSYGPAVIGTTDDRDKPTGRFIAGLAFTRLNVQAPPPSSKWEETPKMLRLVGATNGVIERNELKGGMIELWGGPWRIAENTFAGPPAGTFAHALIGVHEPHDLLIERNKVRAAEPRGKSWRWLVMTNRGSHVRVVRNTVEGIGPRDDDAVEHPNAPETILTESYRLNFEGKTSGTSADGRVVTIPAPQGGPARAGSVLAILSGPQAGQWRRIVLPLGPEAYLLDQPVALAGGAVAIGPGFVTTSFEGNTVDDRGSKVAFPFVLAGQHFGTRLVGNTTRGGGVSARVMAAATESPGPWGWSRTSMFGLVIDGNTFEDAWDGGQLYVEHNALTPPSRGRIYATASLTNNRFASSEAFIAARGRAGRSGTPIALTIGAMPSGDAGEIVVSESGNRAQGKGGAIRVRMATVNGRTAREGSLDLPAEAGAAAGRASSPRR